MSKSTLKLLPALMVAITTVWLSQPVFGVAIAPTLTLTEVSNTHLDWAWDAAGGGFSGSVTALVADSWGPTIISGPNLFAGPSLAFSGSWTEPEGGFNNFAVVLYSQSNLTAFTWTIIVSSDVIGAGAFADGATDDFGLFKLVFFDKGDVATVPETGTTFSLFALSLTGLGFLRRKLSGHLPG